MKNVILILTALAFVCTAQTNTFTLATGDEVGDRYFPSMVYVPALDGFIFNMGAQNDNGQETAPQGPYTVQFFKRSLGHWINFLPHDSLYGSAAVANSTDSANGKWADSTGNAYGHGRGMPYGSPFFSRMDGYLRPLLWNYYQKISRTYNQAALNTDDGKIYYYVNNTTFTFDPATRTFDTLTVARHPNDTARAWGTLMWGAMCYDPVNHEIVLFGGGAVDRPNGTPGTWTYAPATRTWTRLSLAVEPSGRAHSPMVYDAKNQVIVMFGGDHLDSVLSDTWVYQCANRTWVKKSPAKCPSPRAGHGLVYLPKSQHVVLMGGYDFSGLEFEMWRYDAAADEWGLIKRFASGDPAPGHNRRTSIMMAAADTGDRVVALGDTGAPDGYHFNPATLIMNCDASQIDASGTQTYGVTPGATQAASPAPDWYESGVSAPDTAAQEAVLRSIPLQTWVKVTPPKIPSGNRAWSSTIIDPERDIIIKWAGGHVAHCGTDVPQYVPSANRWHAGYVPENPMDYSGYGDPRPGPFTFNNRPFISPHTYHMYDYDRNIHRMLFASGRYTFVYNPDIMDWEYPPVNNPPVVTGNDRTSVWYTARGAVLMQGANSYAANQSVLFLFDADSMKWDTVAYTGTGMPYYYADQTGVVHDTQRDRLVIARYANSTTQIVALDMSTYALTVLSPSNAPPFITAKLREAVYLPNQDRVLYGMVVNSGAHLAYDCANNRWISVPIAKGSSGLTDANLTDWGAGYMYDPRRNLVWLSTPSSNLYVCRLDTATAGVEAADIPGGTAMSVRPNPFNPVVKIAVSGQRIADSRIGIAIYNIDGKIVYRLSATSYQLSAGITWHAAGHPSGLYIARISAGNRTLVKKLVLQK